MPAVPVTRWPFRLTDSSVLAIIPTRYQSTRLPGKPLLDIAGRPMIEHVYRRAADARAVDAVVVATDDERIAAAVEAFGGVAQLTSPDHASGTDRVAEVARLLPCHLIVNVQGDEPLLDSAAIDEAIQPMVADPSLAMSTLARPLADASELARPSVVKVVRDLNGNALYFSRAPIPSGTLGPSLAPARAHIGLYVYRRETLLRLAALAPTPLERAESLEQLRALEHGITIRVVETSHVSQGVDTLEDLERIREIVSRGSSTGFRDEGSPTTVPQGS